MNCKMHERMQVNFIENVTSFNPLWPIRFSSPHSKGISYKSIQFKKPLQTERIKAIG